MRHDSSAPRNLHDGAVGSVKDALGSFWSLVFRDQDLVDALLAARVMSAGQRHIDTMEALSLRDHAGSPVLHREHWHPFTVRLSRRNTASVMSVGMRDTPVIGPQSPYEEVYLPDEVFVVGGNALYSKVNTYPLEGFGPCPVVRVATALCDSISSPRHMLSQGRDFVIENGVLAVRKEKDPFDSGGYLVEDDGDDRVAVLWACDVEFDMDHVADFLGYPLGIYAESTESSYAMLSALWDAITNGLTPITLNRVLGALFGIPVVPRDTVVESVTDSGSDMIVVLADGDVNPVRIAYSVEYTPWRVTRDGIDVTEVGGVTPKWYSGREEDYSLPFGDTPGYYGGLVHEDTDAEGDMFQFTPSAHDDAVSLSWAGQSEADDPDMGYYYHTYVATRERILHPALGESVVPGARLKAGSFLADGISVYWGLSSDDVADLVGSGKLGRVELPPGSVAGVDGTVVIEPGERMMEDGGWFKLSDGDSSDSPFWRSVFARTTPEEREALFPRLSGGGTTVDPMKALGPVVLANVIMVRVSRDLASDACAMPALELLRRLVPPYASLSVVRDVDATGPDDTLNVSAGGEEVQSSREYAEAGSGGDIVSVVDSLSVVLMPIAATEV